MPPWLSQHSKDTKLMRCWTTTLPKATIVPHTWLYPYVPHVVSWLCFGVCHLHANGSALGEMTMSLLSSFIVSPSHNVYSIVNIRLNILLKHNLVLCHISRAGKLSVTENQCQKGWLTTSPWLNTVASLYFCIYCLNIQKNLKQKDAGVQLAFRNLSFTAYRQL